MGIWRVLTAKIYCDICERFLAYMEFDAADEPNIDRIRIKCTECRREEDETE